MSTPGTSPALAIIITIGFLRIWDVIGTRWVRSAVVIVITVTAALSVGDIETGKLYSTWSPVKNLDAVPFPEKEYLGSGRKVLKGEGRVAILGYNPTLQYYLGISDNRLVYLGPQFPAMNRDMLKEMVERRNVSWVAIDTDSVYFVEKNSILLTELWGEPKKIGRMLIFETNQA